MVSMRLRRRVGRQLQLGQEGEAMTTAREPSQFLLAEYKELRGEILKRSEIQHQLISIALVAFGALISVGLKDSPSALLAYPMLALFLAAAWSYNDLQIAQLGIYIRYRIEDELIGGGLGWEHTIKSMSASKEIGAAIKLATRGILWGSEFLAVLLYLLKRVGIGLPMGPAEQKVEVVLLILAFAAVAATMYIMRNRDYLVKKIEDDMQRPAAATSNREIR
jgi:hypothetical protein